MPHHARHGEPYPAIAGPFLQNQRADMARTYPLPRSSLIAAAHARAAKNFYGASI